MFHLMNDEEFILNEDCNYISKKIRDLSYSLNSNDNISSIVININNLLNRHKNL
jgi:hypothetical protein